MNQTSRTDDTLDHPGWNQNPPPLNADATTRQDLNGIANSREQRHHTLQPMGVGNDSLQSDILPAPQDCDDVPERKGSVGLVLAASAADQPTDRSNALTVRFSTPRVLQPLVKFASFVGPGFLIAVAYIDPGNYATDVAAGAQTKYALLFVVLMSNLFAIFLQSLCIKLGSVTGLSLAENCRVHLPKWLVIILYIFSESAILATDVSEVLRAPFFHYLLSARDNY
jgi:metal iron transporter